MTIAQIKRFLPLVVLLTAFTPAPAFSTPVGSLTRVEGSVDVLKLTESVPVAARKGDMVSPGDIIRTLRTGKAEIRFHDDSIIQIAPESRIRVDDYVLSKDNVRRSGFLSLFRGKVRALVSKTKGIMQTKSGSDSNFNIKTRTAIAGVKGTGLIVFYERGVTGVIFTEGHGFVYNPTVPDRIVPMTRGQATFVLSEDAPPAAPRNVSVSQLSVHIEATTVSDSGAQTETEPVVSTDVQGGPGPDGTPAAMPATVIAENTGLPLFINESIELPAGQPIVSQAPSSLPLQGQNQTALVPVTETQPELIATPVTVNVTIPR